MAKRRLSITPTPTAATADVINATTALASGAHDTRDRPFAFPPGGVGLAVPALTESKQARIVGLLRRDEGATIAELMAATGWMSHSARGTLSAVVKRKLGLAIESCLEKDRGRVYRVAPS